jgi:hypothetical protein
VSGRVGFRGCDLVGLLVMEIGKLFVGCLHVCQGILIAQQRYMMPPRRRRCYPHVVSPMLLCACAYPYMLLKHVVTYC